MKILKSRPLIKWRIILVMMLVVWAVFFASAIASAEVLSEDRHATVISTYDGDTFTIETSIWLGQKLTTSVRVDGIDTPEIRTKCPQEKALAIRARDRSQALTQNGVILRNVRWGKYAKRVIADVYLKSGQRLVDVLISEGLGRPYDGGKRMSWCG